MNKEKMYMDWCNNFLTLSTFSEHYEISEDEALDIITSGKKTVESNVKNCKKIFAMSGYIWDYNLLDVTNIDYVYMGMEKRKCDDKDYDKVDDFIAPLLATIIKY